MDRICTLHKIKKEDEETRVKKRERATIYNLKNRLHSQLKGVRKIFVPVFASATMCSWQYVERKENVNRP
jgi:hypothetical protein